MTRTACFLVATILALPTVASAQTSSFNGNWDVSARPCSRGSAFAFSLDANRLGFDEEICVVAARGGDGSRMNLSANCQDNNGDRRTVSALFSAGAKGAIRVAWRAQGKTTSRTYVRCS